MNRVVEMRVLPDGRVRIHLFVFDPKGPVELPQGFVQTAMGPRTVGGAAVRDDDGIAERRGYIACDHQIRSVLPESKRGTIRQCIHSDDVRAVTCPECRETTEFKAMVARLSETLPVGG